MTKEVTDFLSILQPKLFPTCLHAVKVESKFNLDNDSFGSGSFALHFGTTFGEIAAFAKTLCIEERLPQVPEKQKQEFIKILEFRFLAEKRYHMEIGSLALKDLEEKKSSSRN